MMMVAVALMTAVSANAQSELPKNEIGISYGLGVSAIGDGIGNGLGNGLFDGMVGRKWTNEKVDLPVLETLIERSELFPYPHKHLFLFSKSGFTKGCVEKAKELGNVSLVTYAEIVS